jgi:hypothetical protein
MIESKRKINFEDYDRIEYSNLMSQFSCIEDFLI